MSVLDEMNRAIDLLGVKRMTLDEIKKIVVLSRLDVHGGDKKLAAASLGISLKTLYNALHKWGAFERKLRGKGASR